MDTISVKRSYKNGCVAVRIVLKGTVRVEGTTDLSSAQARELAKGLIEEADRADAKVVAKAASQVRRKKWRDREVAAGRMKVMSLSDMFR